MIGRKKLLALGLALLMSAGALAGCGSQSDKKSESKITIAGSTSVQPLSEFLAKDYMKENSGVEILVQGGGSGQAAKSLEESIAHIGALSRNVEKDEKKVIKKEYTIAMDGVAVVVNKDVNVDNLTMNQIKDIFVGKIKNWKEVGGKDMKIAVVSREEGSGTRGAFTEITGVLEKKGEDKKDNTVSSALVQSSTGAVVKTVSKTPGSIGYVSLASIDKSVKSLKVGGIAPSEKTVLDGSYKISRPFIYAVTDKVDANTQKFIDYVISSDGQARVKEAGFIPVKENK